MLIKLKNKDTLKIDDFILKCSIGKNGIKSKKKKEINLHQEDFLLLVNYIIGPIE